MKARKKPLVTVRIVKNPDWINAFVYRPIGPVGILAQLPLWFVGQWLAADSRDECIANAQEYGRQCGVRVRCVGGRR